jgi:hypothetical protein
VTTASGTLRKKIHPPGDPLDERTAGRRASERGQAREGGPEPDRPAGLGAVDLPQQRKAVRGQDRAADSLQEAGRDQHAEARRDSAEDRGHREGDDARDERLAPAVAVSEPAAHEVERRQRQRVRQVDPLLAGQPEAEVLANRRQRDDDDGGVDEGERRAEGGGREREPAR